MFVHSPCLFKIYLETDKTVRSPVGGCLCLVRTLSCSLSPHPYPCVMVRKTPDEGTTSSTSTREVYKENSSIKVLLRRCFCLIHPLAHTWASRGSGKRFTDTLDQTVSHRLSHLRRAHTPPVHGCVCTRGVGLSLSQIAH